MKNLLLLFFVGVFTSMCTRSDDFHTVKMEVTASTSNWNISYTYSVFGGDKSSPEIIKATGNTMTQSFNLDEEALLNLEIITTENATSNETIGVVVSLDGTIVDTKTIYVPNGATPSRVYSRSITKDSTPQESI